MSTVAVAVVKNGVPMGWYGERVLPRMVDRACGIEGYDRWRIETAEGLSGEIVEIGFGSGLNLGAYPAEITRVAAVEPSRTAWDLAGPRVAAGPVTVERVGLDGRSLPLDDHSMDGALCTFTLCTVPDVAHALSEIGRVVRPGGRFHILEHGIAPDPEVARWQRRLEPVQKRLAGGCHLTRDPVALLTEAGFQIERSTSRYGKGPKPWTYLTVAHARTG